MFNSEKPSLDQLPTSAQLLRSSLLAAIGAVIILVAIVLPAEYGIDPTGAGQFLGLTEMGEIKKELAEEAEQDHSLILPSEQSSNIFALISNIFVSPAYAQSSNSWRDEIRFTLKPKDTYELKLTMNQGDVAEYRMRVDGGKVNFDLHAHAGGESITYEKGRGSTGSEGELIAAFDGNHGWFWRNRDKKTVNITLHVRGTYGALKQGK